jgi:hypothetical protein
MIDFRNWVHNLWLENCEERAVYAGGGRLTEKEYFQQFKWWLRREYRHQIKKEKEQNERRKQFGQWA